MNPFNTTMICRRKVISHKYGIPAWTLSWVKRSERQVQYVFPDCRQIMASTCMSAASLMLRARATSVNIRAELMRRRCEVIQTRLQACDAVEDVRGISPYCLRPSLRLHDRESASPPHVWPTFVSRGTMGFTAKRVQKVCGRRCRKDDATWLARVPRSTGMRKGGFIIVVVRG